MDIDELFTLEDHESGSELQLIDKSGNLIDAYVTVKGVDSKSFRLELAAGKRKFALNGSVDTDEIRSEALANITVNWRGLTSKGKELEFNVKKCRQLYYNAPYLMDLIDSFIAKRENFTKS